MGLPTLPSRTGPSTCRALSQSCGCLFPAASFRLASVEATGKPHGELGVRILGYPGVKQTHRGELKWPGGPRPGQESRAAWGSLRRGGAPVFTCRQRLEDMAGADTLMSPRLLTPSLGAVPLQVLLVPARGCMQEVMLLPHVALCL